MTKESKQNNYDIASPEHEQLTRALRDLSVLYDISNAMRVTLELERILYIILTGVTANTGLGFNRAVLFLIDEKKQYLECTMALGPESGEQADTIWKYINQANPNLLDLINVKNVSQYSTNSALYKSLKDLRIMLSDAESPADNLLTYAYNSGTPLMVKEDTLKKYQNDPLLKILQSKELVIMPLKGKDAIKAIIVADNFFNQKPITDEDLKIFIMLANQAGLAIENAQLYELVVHQSHTDSLTNLWHHGYFQHQLLNEIKAAQKNNTPLSLGLIDLDDFKTLNDTCGHQVGDLVLKEIAGILKENSRDIDYPCRYGGEEFSIIWPNTDKHHGLVIAERIRNAIMHHSYEGVTGLHDIPITVSIGLASFPSDSLTPEDLIAKADKAMYIAKFSGKNRSCMFEEHAQ